MCNCIKLSRKVWVEPDSRRQHALQTTLIRMVTQCVYISILRQGYMGMLAVDGLLSKRLVLQTRSSIRKSTCTRASARRGSGDTGETEPPLSHRLSRLCSVSSLRMLRAHGYVVSRLSNCESENILVANVHFRPKATPTAATVRQASSTQPRVAQGVWGGPYSAFQGVF